LKINERGFFTLLIGATLLLFSIIPIVLNDIPETDFPFVSLSVLDSNNMTVDYFSMNNDTINFEDNIHWYIVVENNLNDLSTISLKIKIIDFYTTAPNSFTCVPCSTKSIYEVEKVMNNNDKWIDQ